MTLYSFQCSWKTFSNDWKKMTLEGLRMNFLSSLYVVKKGILSVVKTSLLFLHTLSKSNSYCRFTNDHVVIGLLLFSQQADDALLSYNHGARFLTVEFQPKSITMVPTTGRVYHPGPNRAGGIGLLSDKLALAWTAVRSSFSAHFEIHI